MRLMKQSILKDGSGKITLLPEEPEDMWHAYNLIRPSDILTAQALRKVATTSATGSTNTTRVHTTLTIIITSLDFDSAAGELHVSGRVSQENAHVKLGQYHTLDLELHRNFTLEKAEGWDSIALDVVKQACDTKGKAEVLAVVMQDGLAHLCALTEHQTLLLQKIQVSVPQKRAGRAGDHDKGLDRYFEAISRALLVHLTPDHKAVVLASPGFIAAAYLSHFSEAAKKVNDKALLAAIPKFIVAHSSSGHLHALHEALKDPTVSAKLSSTKYASETATIAKFYDLLRKDDGRAVYGPREVESAVTKSAVGRGGGMVLISDSLFRSQEVSVRKRWVGVVDTVKEEGGEVKVFSSAHESGKRLEALGGVAAVLVFPVEFEDSEDEEDGTNETAA